MKKGHKENLSEKTGMLGSMVETEVPLWLKHVGHGRLDGEIKGTMQGQEEGC